MNVNECLIVINNEDKTKDVVSYEYKEYKTVIKFTNNKDYSYNAENVYINENPKNIKLDNLVIYHIRITLHIFIHVVVILFLEEDVDIRYIQVILMHSSITSKVLIFL